MWWTEGDGSVVHLIIHVAAILIDLSPMLDDQFLYVSLCFVKSQLSNFCSTSESVLLYIYNNVMKNPTPHHVDPHKGDTQQVAITLIAAISLHSLSDAFFAR